MLDCKEVLIKTKYICDNKTIYILNNHKTNLKFDFKKSY